TMVVKMQTNDLSSLSPRLALYNSALASLGQAIAVNQYGATVTMTITGVSPGQVYYIRASAAQVGAGSNGAFGLLLNFGSNPRAPTPPPNTAVASQPDQGVNGWMGASTRHGHHHRGRGAGHALAPSHDGDQIVVKLGGHKSVAHALMVGRAHPT